jgi:hypothetical protein
MEMKVENEAVIFTPDETVLESVFKDVVTGVMLAFCVYISQDSTWWTFISGLMFMLFMFVRIAAIFKRAKNKFRTKEEHQSWIDNIDL